MALAVSNAIIKVGAVGNLISLRSISHNTLSLLNIIRLSLLISSCGAADQRGLWPPHS